MQVLDLSQNSELGDLGVARLALLSALTSLNLSGASMVGFEAHGGHSQHGQHTNRAKPVAAGVPSAFESGHRARVTLGADCTRPRFGASWRLRRAPQRPAVSSSLKCRAILCKHTSYALPSLQVTLGTLPLLPALQHLEVASTDTDDAALLALEHQPALARLSIADCQVRASRVLRHDDILLSGGFDLCLSRLL